MNAQEYLEHWRQGEARASDGLKAMVALGELFNALQRLVKHGTERRGEAVVLMFDEEDGFWLSTVDCGCHHYPVKDITGAKRKTLAEAVKAAVAWHNKQREKPHRDYLKHIPLNNGGQP